MAYPFSLDGNWNGFLGWGEAKNISFPGKKDSGLKERCSEAIKLLKLPKLRYKFLSTEEKSSGN